MDFGTLAAKLTPDNGAVKSLKDLLIATNFVDEELERFFTLRQNVHNGDKLAQKEWAIGDWQIPLKWCYTDLQGTIAEYCLKTGTDIGDLTSTEYMDDIVMPALDLAIKRMMWRLIWFGDKDAKAATSSGVITADVDVDLFKPTNGFWKQLFAVCTSNSAQHTTIAANSEASAALQKSKLREAGIAIGIFDEILDNADPRIAAMDGAAIFCTKSLGDALTRDLKQKYNLILTWEQIFKGLDVTEYDGTTIYRVSIWDRYIQAYQNDGTKLNLPHRAVFGSPKQLFVGTPANQLISELDIWFDHKDRMNYLYSTGKLGCLIGEDNLFQIAY